MKNKKSILWLSSNPDCFKVSTKNGKVYIFITFKNETFGISLHPNYLSTILNNIKKD